MNPGEHDEVAQRLGAAGFSHAWRRDSGRDELVVMVPPEEYDLEQARAVEADLVELTRLKVWVTFFRVSPYSFGPLF